MEFTHEEMLEKIKEGRKIAQELVETSKNIRTEAECELWKSSKALVMTIDRFSQDAVKDAECAESLLNVIEKTMINKFLPLLAIMSIKL